MFSRLAPWLVGSAALLIVPMSFAEEEGLEAVVVTAQRREEPAQAVGISISVLSGDTLLDKSVTVVNDLQNAVPSLQVEPA